MHSESLFSTKETLDEKVGQRITLLGLEWECQIPILGENGTNKNISGKTWDKKVPLLGLEWEWGKNGTKQTQSRIKIGTKKSHCWYENGNVQCQYWGKNGEKETHSWIKIGTKKSHYLNYDGNVQSQYWRKTGTKYTHSWIKIGAKKSHC